MSSLRVTAARPRAASLPRFQRVRVRINGRYMLPDRQEFPCEVTEMSPGDCWIDGQVPPLAGQTVVAYLDQLGRIEGQVAEAGNGGFRLELAISPRKRDRLATQLTWLANKDALALPEDRRHERIVPDIRMSELRLDSGVTTPCKVIDISLSGAGIETPTRPPVGTLAHLGRLRVRVVRHFGDGIGLEFLGEPQGLAVIENCLRLL